MPGLAAYAAGQGWRRIDVIDPLLDQSFGWFMLGQGDSDIDPPIYTEAYTGSVNGHQFKLTCAAIGPGVRPNWAAIADFSFPYLGIAYINPRGGNRRYGERRPRIVTTGDAAFDARFEVSMLDIPEGSPPHVLRALTAPVRALLLPHDDWYLEFKGDHLTFACDTVDWSLAGVQGWLAQVDAVVGAVPPELWPDLSNMAITLPDGTTVDFYGPADQVAAAMARLSPAQQQQFMLELRKLDMPQYVALARHMKQAHGKGSGR